MIFLRRRPAVPAHKMKNIRIRRVDRMRLGEVPGFKDFTRSAGETREADRHARHGRTDSGKALALERLHHLPSLIFFSRSRKRPKHVSTPAGGSGEANTKRVASRKAGTTASLEGASRPPRPVLVRGARSFDFARADLFPQKKSSASLRSG
jgi:hypothetical protein